MSEPSVQPTAAVLKAVRAAKVEPQKIAEPVEHTAEVESSVQMEVASKINGEIREVLKKRGEMVEKGEVILTLISDDVRLDRERADQAVKAAEQALETTRKEIRNAIAKLELSLHDLTRNYNKMRNDYDSGLATQAQLDQAESQLKNTRLDYDQQKQRLNSSELANSVKNAKLARDDVYQAMADLEIKAPVSGILSELTAEEGMAVQVGAKLGLVQNLDPINIKAGLSEEQAKLLRSKTEVTYFLPGTSQFVRGNISYLSTVIDPQTKNYDLVIEVANPDMKLKPGMKVRIRLTDEHEGIVLAVPTYGILTQGEENYVFVLAGETVEKRKIQLGRVNEPYHEVLAGVTKGELVVINGLNQLQDKEKVQLTSVE